MSARASAPARKRAVKIAVETGRSPKRRGGAGPAKGGRPAATVAEGRAPSSAPPFEMDAWEPSLLAKLLGLEGGQEER
ncbi:MAG TPA: hypothetical protein VFV10_06345 [Gammaproteobacteria bacterium]|nr:hypothetical protein [Gammaproteobacteria bacterium]